MTKVNWSKVAEKAVRKGMNPEEAGRLSVEAESIIYSWLKGNERTKALKERGFARRELLNQANKTISKEFKSMGGSFKEWEY